VWIGLLFIGLASISWGTTGATMALLARDTGIGPLLVGWARLAVAAPCLLLAAVPSEIFAARTRRLHARSAWAPRAIASYVLLGLAMAAYQICYFRAVTLTGVAVAALLAICSAPLLIAILAAVLLRERLPAIVRVSLGMAVTGTALLVVGPRGLGQISGHFGLGALLALGAGVSYAVYAVAAKGVLMRIAPLPVAAMTFTLGALFLAPALLAERAPLGQLRPGWPWLLYLGIGPTAAAYVLFTIGLRRVPATVAGIVSLLEPLTAAMLGVVAFGESLGALGLAGAVLLVTSLALLGRRGRIAGNTLRTRASRSRGSPPG
jgi:drug/metabolite transporter, DME family